MKISFSIYKNSLQKIYLQLYEALKRCIETSELKANEKLPSVRQIAIKFDINILTVLKAYDLLEKNNYIYKVRGKGCFVKEKEILSSRNQKPILSNFATLNHKINFASATPSSTTYPLQIFQSLMEESFQTYGSSIFNYFDSQGMLELRQCIQKYLQEKQIYTKSQNIQIISESQQGFICSKQPWKNFFPARKYLSRHHNSQEYCIFKTKSCMKSILLWVHTASFLANFTSSCYLLFFMSTATPFMRMSFFVVMMFFMVMFSFFFRTIPPTTTTSFSLQVFPKSFKSSQ